MDLCSKGIRTRLMCALFWTVVSTHSSVSMALANLQKTPEPDPPAIDLGKPAEPSALPITRGAASVQEWVYHKSADNLHPDGREQQMMWLMNRARSNPTQEGVWLGSTNDPLIEAAINYWHVNLNILRAEFDDIAAKPPAAFDVRLYNAAKVHSDDLIVRDTQDHDNQFARISDAGFQYTQARGSVFAYMDTARYGHAAFNIDWGADGGDGSGMQPGRGHRQAIMSIDGDYTNVGLAVLPESDPDTQVGPFVTTGNYCRAHTGYADHYNRFLVGTVWQDADGDNQYDPGEGMADITVLPDEASYFAVTADSGGYAIPILAAGTVHVTFSGPGMTTPVTRAVTVGEQSVLLDLPYVNDSAAEPLAVTGVASDISVDSANLNGKVATNGRVADYYFEYGTTTAYGYTTPADTAATDSAVAAAITDLFADTTYHFRLVAANSEGTSFGADQSFRTGALNPADGGSANTPVAPGSGGSGGCFILSSGSWN